MTIGHDDGDGDNGQRQLLEVAAAYLQTKPLPKITRIMMMAMESEDANDRRSSYDDYDDHLHPTHTIIVT